MTPINNNQMSEELREKIEKILLKYDHPIGEIVSADEITMEDELSTLISHERAEAYKKGAEDFCRWNCNNADGGYVQDLENFMKSEEYLSNEK